MLHLAETLYLPWLHYASADLVGRYQPPWETKARTLEFYVLHEGWHRPKELIENALAGERESLPPERSSVKVRHLRYFRLGLLERRRARRGFEYTITTRGEKRLLHLWKSRGYLDPARAVTPLEREKLIYRKEVAILLLEKHIREARAR
ncbi:MAG: hypothetical protein ABR867_04655 [Nitrososphaerales archaeon]|jgi:hypothetical protein